LSRVGRFKSKRARGNVINIASLTPREQLIAESTLKSTQAKEMLADTLITMHRTILDMEAARAAGTLTAEDRGNMPPLSSNIRRNLEAMGLGERHDPADVSFGDDG
jgi:hypothetical protein